MEGRRESAALHLFPECAAPDIVVHHFGVSSCSLKHQHRRHYLVYVYIVDVRVHGDNSWELYVLKLGFCKPTPISCMINIMSILTVTT